MTAPQTPDPSLLQDITSIANSFPLFACFDCAAAIQTLLISRNVPGKRLLLSTGSTQKPFCNIY